jgi:tRNA threonylcarbamoyladenosine biosynthesis protein TsaE
MPSHEILLDVNLADGDATLALGQALARALPVARPGAVRTGAAPMGGEGAAADAGAASGIASGGAVVYLFGELGAGKTTCVRGLLLALGVAGLVRSPTYTLVETYMLPALTCVHVDLYRLQTLSEVDELGLRDLVGPGCLLLVEWPEKGGGCLPPADVELYLQYAGEAREARLYSGTALGIEWLQNLGRDTSLSFYVSNIT